MTTWIALILVGFCAVLWDAGIILQKVAVDALPPVRVGRGSARVLKGLLTSKRWMAGLAASAAGWGLFAWALSFTPVSVARTIQGSGFVILAVFCMIVLRLRLTAAEWLGVALVTAGVITLGFVDRPEAAAAAGATGPAPLQILRTLPALGACLLAASAAWALPRVTPLAVAPVVVFSIAAGVLLGLGDVCTRAVLLVLEQGGPGWTAGGVGVSLVVFYVSGFLFLSRAYQHGQPVTVTAVSDLCSRLAAIVMGVAALGERLPSDPDLRFLTMLGFGAVLAGAVLLSRFGGESVARRRGSENQQQPPQREGPPPAKADVND